MQEERLPEIRAGAVHHVCRTGRGVGLRDCYTNGYAGAAGVYFPLTASIVCSN